MNRETLTVEDVFGPMTAMIWGCHDEPDPSPWFCGRCPYMNTGPICTKCGAPRVDGQEMHDAPE